MTVVVILQARMGSTRLPGKVAADLDGTPMLAFMLDRLRPGLDWPVVVATSTEPSDDRVAAIAAAAGAPVVRGPEVDVLGRFALALARHPADHVVRLTADCPLIDPTVVADVVARHHDTDADYTSNTLVRTFPDGLDVEVVRADALSAAVREATDAAEREHVTPFVYRRPERFKLEALVAPVYAGDDRWTVDTSEDLDWVRKAVAVLGSRQFGWRDVLAAPGLGRTSVSDPTRLLPADESRPARRVWDLWVDGRRTGRVSVSVEAGVGVAELNVAFDARHVAEQLLRQRLAADAQVAELRVLPPGPS